MQIKQEITVKTQKTLETCPEGCAVNIKEATLTGVEIDNQSFIVWFIYCPKCGCVKSHDIM